MSVLSAMPSSFAAGTTVKLRRSFSGYSAEDGWSCALLLRGIGALDVDSTTDGADFVTTLAATDTATLAAGTYRWVERLTLDDDVADVAGGSVVVLPNLADAAAGDLQSRDERELVIVNAAIAGQLSGGMASYQIQGRMVQNIPLAELLKMRGQLEARIARRRIGGSIVRSIGVRFVDR